MPSPFAEVLDSLRASFEALDLAWYVFGAQAALVHGAVRMTADVDVTVFPGDRTVEALTKVVEAHGFELRGGGRNRTAPDTTGLDDSRTVSRAGICQDTSKEHEQTALPDILMTMSPIPDVNRELAEVGAMFAVFDALRRNRGHKLPVGVRLDS